uniref:polygalacturonase-like n=1 Tax=Erigeron canadensis TaxID=72917 RepID=UPI001CB9493E|nr:polygalacturonase-like [Erigeron canadensis]
MDNIRAICCFFLMALVARNHAGLVDIKAKGAKGDGKTDDGPAINNAWKEACAGAAPSGIVFPPGTYMAFPPINLTGPCKGPMEIKATGATIKAPPELEKFKTGTWISIMYVDRLTMTGGTFDGQGQESWKNKKCGDKQTSCDIPANINFGFCKHSLIKNVTSVNSKYFHIIVLRCDNTTLEHITINAPKNSPNTDGIHLSRLIGVNITNANIKTGDDCISFSERSENVRVEKVTCGPGHGISIGSLGKNPNERPVHGIWIKNCTLIGTDNGVRIKSWAAAHPGSVNDVHFEEIIMEKVANPIVIDQNYCPAKSCKV